MSAAATSAESILRPTMPELDAVRGVAVSMVLCYHGFHDCPGAAESSSGLVRFLAIATRPGWLGVQVFFVLSGFLISGVLLDSRTRSDYLPRFYYRRALRILPAYLATLVVLAVTGLAGGPFLLASLFFLSNVVWLIGIPLQYTVLWSLAVEEQFYLLWPLAVKWLSPRRLATLAMGIVAGTPAVAFFARQWHLDRGIHFYTWFVADALAMGALVSLLTREKWASRRLLWATALAALVSGTFGVLLGGTHLPIHALDRRSGIGAAVQMTPWIVFFAGSILACLLVGSGSRQAWVRPAPLRFIGRISYGLYLYHMLFFKAYDGMAAGPTAPAPTVRSIVTRFVVCGAASVVTATWSRRWLEEPFLRLKDRRFTRSSVAPTSAVPAPTPPA